MREAIATRVMGTEQPFSVVEDELYNHMMKTATPFFEKTNRNTIKEYCFTIYDDEKKKLKGHLKIVSNISLTTDCWKSTHQKIEYMVITGHFIDHTFRYHCFLIFFSIKVMYISFIILNFTHEFFLANCIIVC